MADVVETVIKVKVVPRSSRTGITGKDNDVYRVKLTAPPVEGRANNALIALLAEKLGVPKRDVEIVSGERGRLKTVRIRGLTPGDLAQALQA
ncbi:Conserved hypothetical protein [sediment metagenome]|uniref:Protein containing DUF167 n=1 Tax=sediment metagenome TaxID=749907 RepID=D9PI94_9ZZZZ